MWYFSWILGLGLACAFGILNAIWFELMEEHGGEDDASTSSYSHAGTSMREPEARSMEGGPLTTASPIHRLIIHS